MCVGFPVGVHGDAPPPATEADHVIAIEDGGGWSIENGQGLCASCHGRKSLDERRRRQGGAGEK